MAEDPLLLEWMASDQKNPQLQRLSEQKIRGIAQNYDYNNTFIVSAVTHEYWSESGLMDKVSADDPKDKWFFDAIQAKNRISINIDYNGIIPMSLSTRLWEIWNSLWPLPEWDLILRI